MQEREFGMVCVLYVFNLDGDTHTHTLGIHTGETQMRTSRPRGAVRTLFSTPLPPLAPPLFFPSFVSLVLPRSPSAPLAHYGRVKLFHSHNWYQVVEGVCVGAGVALFLSLIFWSGV